MILVIFILINITWEYTQWKNDENDVALKNTVSLIYALVLIGHALYNIREDRISINKVRENEQAAALNNFGTFGTGHVDGSTKMKQLDEPHISAGLKAI